MTGEEMLHSAARLVTDRRESYGDPAVLMRRSRLVSITLGRPVTACPGGALPDRPEARSAGARSDALRLASRHCGYAAVLREVVR